MLTLLIFGCLKAQDVDEFGGFVEGSDFAKPAIRIYFIPINQQVNYAFTTCPQVFQLAAGQTLRANRQQNGPNIAQGVQALATSLEEQLTAEESRFAIMQSEPKKTALRRVRVAVNSVGDEYANTNFITQLIAEATPQQADGGE